MPSTRDLGAVPNIEGVRTVLKSVAVLDAILMPEWELRYYSYNARWGPGEEMASMRNGSGDEYLVLFAAAGAVIKGFAHESVMGRFASERGSPWPGMLEGLPDEFDGFHSEPAFDISHTSFCLWRRGTDARWEIGPVEFPDAPDPDGSEALLRILDADPRTYQRWCEEYYERAVPLSAIERVYRHEVLTDDLVAQLNAKVEIADLKDLEEIGYPARGG